MLCGLTGLCRGGEGRRELLLLALGAFSSQPPAGDSLSPLKHDISVE